MPRKLKEAAQNVLNAVTTPLCLFAVLLVWPLTYVLRVRRASH